MPTLLFQFKQLMLSIDPDDDDDIPPPSSQSGHGTPAAAGTPSGGQAGDADDSLDSSYTSMACDSCFKVT